MQGMMYVLGLILAVLAGLHVTRNPSHVKRKGAKGEGGVEEAKEAYEATTGTRREGTKFFLGPIVFHLGAFVGVLVVVTVVVLIMDLTYAHYIGSWRKFTVYLLGASILGLILSWIFRASMDEFDMGSLGDTFKGEGSSKQKVFGMVAGFAVLVMVIVLLLSVGSFMAVVCVPILLIAVAAVLFSLYRMLKVFDWGPKEGGHGRLGILGPGRAMDIVRVVVVAFCVLVLFLSSLLPYVNPSNLDRNDLYDSLQRNRVDAENPTVLENTQEVRVVSWQLATEYLQRAYGDSAAFLDTSEYGLLEYTDPAYVNDLFVWVNAPYYEAWKWFGQKKVPFFVYVENDPANLTGETGKVTHKVETELEVHQTRITWSKRIEQLCFERYAAKYEIAQIRFTIDDDENPYWVVYLAERDLWYNRLHMRQLLVISAVDMDDNEEYSVDDDDIPEWLEVVYPDEYVYTWVSFWAENRLGIGYKWFNKAHLYEPDDVAARFIVIGGRTYWQIPLVQKNSHVLGGYVWVDTRTGDATFFNRENRSLADKDTVEEQIQKYLSSGALGFQKLDIHEGYLYPIRLATGEVREAYVFPLYAGLTVQKYAVVDAEEYTSEPYIENDLGLALDRYRGRSGGGGGTGLEWQQFNLSSGYVDGEEAVLSVSNATVTNMTLVVDPDDLAGGLVEAREDEMRELRLAVAAWGRGDPVSLRLVLQEGLVIDVDWEGSDLVT